MDQEQLEQKKHTSQTHTTSQTTPPSHNHKKHGIMMFACCLIPIVLMIAISAFGFKFKSLGSLAVLLCPLMHVGMMLSMRKSKNKPSCCAHDEKIQLTAPPQ